MPTVRQRDVPPEVWAKLTAGDAAPVKPRTPAPLVTPGVRWSLTLIVPVRVVSAANAREHWAARSRRVKGERIAVAAALFAAMPAAPAFDRVVVTLTRLGGRRWDDDNNVSGLKGARDSVAEWLRVDDGDPRVTFAYAQEPGGACGVRIEITTAESARADAV